MLFLTIFLAPLCLCCLKCCMCYNNTYTNPALRIPQFFMILVYGFITLIQRNAIKDADYQIKKTEFKNYETCMENYNSTHNIYNVVNISGGVYFGLLIFIDFCLCCSTVFRIPGPGGTEELISQNIDTNIKDYMKGLKYI